MIDSTDFWQTIIFLSLGTMAIRGSFIFFSDKVRVPSRIKELFAYIPAAVIPALITPMVFFHEGQAASLLGKERLVVMALAPLVFYFSKSMLITVSSGLLLLYIAGVAL